MSPSRILGLLGTVAVLAGCAATTNASLHIAGGGKVAAN